jgi:hypothetical protein
MIMPVVRIFFELIRATTAEAFGSVFLRKSIKTKYQRERHLLSFFSCSFISSSSNSLVTSSI